MDKNLNKELYSKELFKVWSEKKDLLSIEEYFINKYLNNKNSNIIEAGTGGGRIIFEIEKLGFTNLEAFDYVEKMIHFCNEKKKKSNSSINFKTADATNLIDYGDNKFEYLLYLQQVLCFIDIDNLPKALDEAHRIGKQNSIYLFSFLNWESKFYNPILSKLVNFFRFVRGEKIDKYKLPWLNINGNINWRFLNKNQPQNTWFKEEIILEILNNCGFTVLEAKSRLNSKDKAGHLHIACKKRI
ncbi:class I SAM-dependent methyltransferase [uncultured Algibacter sp.]|uniref:class I SAM-dependent methyltransferase n=1 Tax=uncultured Algibacter sp. TaxID=298659 RepID=UPI00261C235E|nr:class I SAM-dependent methyltransferase [uncultured Algibacter sp.]